MITPRAASALALLTVAVGVVIQILGGSNYPLGIPVMLAAAGIVWFVPRRWAPALAIAAAISHIVGFLPEQANRLIEVETALDTLGLWMQTVAVVVALATAVIAFVRPHPSASRRLMKSSSKLQDS